eukprot:772275-Pyramimonas_sp.AAC.1
MTLAGAVSNLHGMLNSHKCDPHLAAQLIEYYRAFHFSCLRSHLTAQAARGTKPGHRVSDGIYSLSLLGHRTALHYSTTDAKNFLVTHQGTNTQQYDYTTSTAFVGDAFIMAQCKDNGPIAHYMADLATTTHAVLTSCGFKLKSKPRKPAFTVHLTDTGTEPAKQRILAQLEPS